jgi:hypothetical protein
VYPSGTTYWGTWHADPDYSQAQGDPHDLGCRGAGQGGQGHLLGVAVVGLHAGVFIANTVLLSSGGDVNALALLVPSAVAIVAAYLAVDGSRLRAG